MHLLRGSEGTLAGQSRLELEGRSNSRQWWGVCWSWIVLGTVVMAGGQRSRRRCIEACRLAPGDISHRSWIGGALGVSDPRSKNSAFLTAC